MKLKLTQHMLTTAILLAGFAITGTGLVAFAYEKTKVRIAQSEREALLRSLHSVVNPEHFNNDLFNDQILVTSQPYLGSKQPLPVFRARNNGQPFAAVITAVAPDGYNGDIKLLIGIRYDGSITGVRVISHQETPGLGDYIEIRRSNWILTFNDRSIGNPEQKYWKVKRDGGYFDQLTGATITPRAIVKAVAKALEYYALNKDALFTAPSTTLADQQSTQAK